jgi:hypothetical protein
MQPCHFFATSGCRLRTGCTKGSHDPSQVLNYLASIVCPICVKHGQCTAQGCTKSHAPEVIQRYKLERARQSGGRRHRASARLTESVVIIGCVFVVVFVGVLASATAPEDSNNTSTSQRDQKTTKHDQTDFAESFRLLRIKASQGDRDAEFQVGVMLRDGQGVERDYEAAARWFRRAAMQQHPRAQFNLGLMLQQGQGVKKDISEALGLFRRAAHQNHPEAQFHLGDMLENGRGVARDRGEALRWYTLASQQGFAMATAAWKKMRMQAGP